MAENDPNPEAKVLVVNGKPLDEDDLTFREKRELRRVVLEELMGDANGDITDAYTDDFLLAMLFVVLKRDKPEMTIEDALDLKLSDFFEAPEVPPTRAARAKK